MNHPYAPPLEFSNPQSIQRDELTHSVVVAYLFWLGGWMGAHRFYLGHQISGTIYFFTFGLLGVGWIIDAFYIPRMCREASNFYIHGKYDYNVAWLLFAFLGYIGVHRFYLGKWFTALLYLCTLGLCGVGLIYDLLLLNEIVNERNKACLNIEPTAALRHSMK